MTVFGQTLPSWPRGKTVIDEIVLHESVTSSRAKTVEVLKRRSLSVHIIVDRDGSVTHHAPLADQCAHAGGKHNRRSIAVEVVNRYYGSQGDEGEPDIAAVWAHKGWYILPTLLQLEATWQVVIGLHESHSTIPLDFPGIEKGGFRWGRYSLAKRLRPPPGIVSHHRFDHADGLVPEHYCYMRALDFAPAEAYRLTVAAASSGKRLTEIPGAVS